MPLNNPDRLAVVIPTYNRGRSLRRCLDSVCAQTRLPDEIIVVDDGSTDNSTVGLVNLYPKIRVIHQPNRGVSAARNAGIRASQSDWIAFLDSDDVWLDTKCEKQLTALRLNPEYRICHTQEQWIYKGTPKPVPSAYNKKEGWIFSDCLPRCAISPSTAILHRELLQSVGMFDESLPACEDYDLWLRISSTHPVLLVDEPLIEKHGGHEDQLSNQRGLDSYRILALEKFLDNSNSDSEYYEAARKTLIQKCDIIARGAEKNGHTTLATKLKAIRDRFA